VRKPTQKYSKTMTMSMQQHQNAQQSQSSGNLGARKRGGKQLNIQARLADMMYRNKLAKSQLRKKPKNTTTITPMSV
jgi:hypothetical protein